MSDASHASPSIKNNVPKPPGVLPRHAQGVFIGSIALVIVLVIAFTGGKTPKDKTATPIALSVSVPDDSRIREYRARIEQQIQKIAAEQARQREFEAPSLTATPSPIGAPLSPPVPRPASEAAREKDWIARDQEKRAYESRYASNVSLSRRSAPKYSDSPLETLRTPGDLDGPAAKDVPPKVTPDLQQADGKLYRLLEGTVLETALTNRLDGSFSGPINCQVTTPVYSHDRMHLLIPQGTRALGTVSRVNSEGQQRLAVTFHRLIMPDGYSVSLDKLPGLSQQGETGLLDQINHHYLQIFGVSLAIGAIAGLSEANTQYGANATSADAYRQGVANSLSQTSLHILDRYLNVLPTFTVREGHRVKVYLTADLSLPAYENHRIANDL
jgi:type IV secretion system protein VirB10